MKKLIIPTFIMCTSILLFTCEPQANQPISADENNVIDKITKEQLEKINDSAVVIEIDGCEYIIAEWKATNNRGYGFMSHKGNCKNTIHIYNQLQDSTSTSSFE